MLSVEHEVDVRAQREGTVQQLVAEEGRRVQAGELLGRLDDRAMQSELDKARADLMVAQNNVKYKQAENQAKEANLKRQQLLRSSGLSSDADLEQAEFEAKATAYEIDSWNALVKSNQAQIQSLQIELEQTQFRAPFSGVVARRYVRVGQTVTKDDPCFRVSQLGPLQVNFQVPESSNEKPAVGGAVRLSVVSNANRTLSARIIKVGPTVDPASDSFDVTAQLDGDVSGLSPGMAVRVSWTPRGASAGH
ncbi:MAG TPA: efflux RND transporter periplasmic adaptor subunit [Candidatus Acidoferrales bacterium]|nr:efflux RND transporter periplasmic adaptor subunit [Candidatus Acidoferrum sp.]HUJ83896.1 efflux RND transporter periplasmic adaptor subunit [Candidatus Acidoferrales bacterium]